MPDFDPAIGSQPHERVYANALSEGLRTAKYLLLNKPSVHPFVFTTATQVPALPTASQGQIDTVFLPQALGCNVLEMFQTTAQSKFPAIVAAEGLEIGLDLVDNETVEYVPGGNHTFNPLAYTVGTTPGVLIRLKVKMADVSGTDQFLVGFRKQESYAVPTSLLSTGDGIYTDFFGIGLSGTANPNDVKTMSDLNNGGSTTVTDTLFNVADGDIVQYEVRVRAGVVTAYINGVRLGDTVGKDGDGTAITSQATAATAAFTFDTGDLLIPTIIHRYVTTTPGVVYLRRLEVAQLLEVGLQPEGRGPQ